MELWRPLVKLNVSTLGLYDDERYPGRCLLVLDEHWEDLATVPENLACDLLADARRAASAVQKAVGADRINYAVLGNVEPHVHFHLIPRRWSEDPAPGRSPWHAPGPATRLEPSRREVIEESIKRALSLPATPRTADVDGSEPTRTTHQGSKQL
jgi:diadenosine tetraphosphate (Ap4A) HIT family hydrolase